jgi:hypothetical protein|tara:strand:+ start:587 stop:736 length:150 start_codon:yes stop_codon:yes gene_type:complete
LATTEDVKKTPSGRVQAFTGLNKAKEKLCSCQVGWEKLCSCQEKRGEAV